MKNRNGIYTDDLRSLMGNFDNTKKVSWKNREKYFVENSHVVDPKKISVKQKPCVCLDTNVVISLTALWYGNEGLLCQTRTKKNIKDIKSLQKLIEHKKITVVVTPYVLQELYIGSRKYGEDCFRYMKNNNVFVLDIPKEKDVYYFEDVENTALRYCGRQKNPYAPHPREGKKEEDKIFPMAYEYRIKRPNIDARIMAESSLLGCVLLTQNSDHFLAYGKDADIERINKNIKLGENIKPFRPSAFVAVWELGGVFPCPKGKYKPYIKNAKEIEL